MKRFYGWGLIFACLIFAGSTAGAANIDYRYQFDDVAGSSGSGAQWVALTTSRDLASNIVGHSIGAATTARMSAETDLVTWNNPLFISGDEGAPNTHFLHSAFVVIPEGLGTMPVNFKYVGSEPDPVTLAVYAAGFEDAYRVGGNPTPPFPPRADVNVDLSFTKISGNEKYKSDAGELVFHQNPTSTPSQTLHIPFVVASVRDGDATGDLLDIKSTTRTVSGDIVARRWFKWDAKADKVEPAYADDWIFVPLDLPDPNLASMDYNFTTEVTNHSGLRYGIQRYDTGALSADHWKFDLSPVNPSLRMSLPQKFWLHPLSHIAPGLVTVYSHNARVMTRQQNLLRIAAVDPLGQLLASKALQLNYRTIIGYNLSNADNQYYALNAFEAYPSRTDFFKNALKEMEISATSWQFPTTNVLAGAVSFKQITADAISSFAMSAPVPGMGASADVSGDISPAMLGLHVVLRVPKARIAAHWDNFAMSRNLAADFAEKYRLWFRAPNDSDLDLTKFLKDKGKYDRTVKVFLDEENENLTVHYVLLTIEESGNGLTKKPKIRMVSDTTVVNDYDYIVINDGVNDGVWEMTFYAAPEVIIPPSDGEGGGGCSAGAGFLAGLLVLPMVLRSAKLRLARKIFIIVLIGTAMFAVPVEAALAPAMVSYGSDISVTVTGSLRWAINQVNIGSADTIVFNDIDVIALDPAPPLGAITLSEDAVIYGNGVKIRAGGSTRLFEVVSGANVTFNAMTFADGSAAGNGGAVLVSDGSTKFEFCTFDNNDAANGGAVYVASGDASFTNCTFFENDATANGGAVAGSVNSSLVFSFVTMYGNTAGGVGQAINAGGTANSLLASLIVGNGSGQQQVTLSGASNSRGYNVFGDTSIGTSGTNDFFSATTDNVFISPIALARNDAAPGWKNWTYTLKIIDNGTNPALALVPKTVSESNNVWTDQRMVERGAGGSGAPSSSGAYEVYDKSDPITSLQIGGLPNGIATIGYSVLLAVRVNPPKANPGVSWTTSNANVVAATAFGRVWSVGKGSAVMTVTTTGFDANGERVTQQIPVIVKYSAEENPGYHMPDPNVSPANPPSDGGGGGGGCNAGFAVIPTIFLYSLYRLFSVKKNVKNKFLMGLILLGAIFAWAGNGRAASFTATIIPNTWNITVGGNSFDFTVTPSPVPTTCSYGTWQFSDTSKISWTSVVPQTANVAGLAAGTVLVSIDVTSSDTSGSETVTAVATITVYPMGLETVSIPTSAVLELGGKNTMTLVPAYNPAGYSPTPTPTWSTSDQNVVSVTAAGVITALAKGKATITCTVQAVPKQGGNLTDFTATCEVTVLQAVTGMSITPTPQNVTVGGTSNIAATFTPTDADSTDVKWSIVTTGVSPTFATIAATPPTAPTATFNALSFIRPTPTENPVRVQVRAESVFWLPVSADCDVIIDPIPVTGVTISPLQIMISKDMRAPITTTLTPSNATEASRSLTPGNPLVASVALGIVTGVREGTTPITYTFTGWAINAGRHDSATHSASSTVTVIAPPPGIRVSGVSVAPSTLSLRRGLSYQLFPTITPYNATNKTIYWRTDNPLVATVNDSGVITAHAEGHATIYVITADAGVGGTVLPAECAVTVTTSGGTPNDPALLPIDPVVKQQIEDMNKAISSSGIEVGFGFELERPSELSLTDYGVLPAYLSKLDASSNVKIELAGRANPNNFDTVGSASKIEIDVSALSTYGWTAVVPVSLKLTLTEAMLGKYLPAGTPPSAVLANPRAYLGILFTAFSLQKQIIETGSADFNKFIRLFATPQAALRAVDDGVLFVKTLGSKLEITLNYFVADSGNTTAQYIANSLIIGDGAGNGFIRDPVWLLAPAQGGGGGGDGGGGGGCNAASGIGLFALIAALFRRRE